MSLDFERARFNMVEQQVRPWDVLDARVLDVLREVRREDFVPAPYRKLAFADVAIPLEHGEFMMKPVVEGRLLQSLLVAPEDAVLEIGTGSGFLTACLARLGREVVSVDIHADLADRARGRLEQMGIANIRIETGEAIHEWSPNRRFDVIAVTGATFQIPSRFRDWLAPNGRLFAIRGESPAQQAVTVARLGENDFSETNQFETDLPYLIHAAPPKRFTL